ncbi:alpha/beta-hydrolase [Mytilinidion resinicola]|uniref:1-alkyl-2-acetylglycerophosphocholine esterase n=1 Tax=Mytilinidion resinicola TaxID=574789 RepID=A0A6A6YYV6_9PEZI|nr:alpha/beta-hydrolase [Mytilinidion resinicola]KAF2813623.1 alpha/beta-hydrolase [Mytilinidion resinicola]
MKLSALLPLLPAVVAIPFPPPTGPYGVGITQHVFNHTTPNDPVAFAVKPSNGTGHLLTTIYYPTLQLPTPLNTTAPYLDPTTASVWGDPLLFSKGALETLTTWTQWQAPTLKSSTGLPTVIFSPGGGENAVMYSYLTTALASNGYTVLALDHPGEAPYVQFPYGGDGYYGIDITATWNRTLMTDVYKMRISDAQAIIHKLFPPLVESYKAPFNTTHFVMIGHSIGGAAAAGAMELEPSIIGGVNLDGGFFPEVSLPDVKRPFLLMAGSEHTPAIDPTWSPFSKNQSGYWQWVNITGTAHQDYSDLADWVDLLDMRNKTAIPGSFGTIWAPRMDFLVSTFVEALLDLVLGVRQHVLDGPSSKYPEVVFVNESRKGY